MLSPELFRETLDTANVECWERERTATLTRRNASRSHTIDHRFLGTPVRAFAVRLHATSCSFREIQEILRLFGVQRSHQVIFQWVHRVADSVPDPPEAKPKRVAVDETAVKINGEWSWLYAAASSVQISWFHAKVSDLIQSSVVSAFALLKQFEKQTVRRFISLKIRSAAFRFPWFLYLKS